MELATGSAEVTVGGASRMTRVASLPFEPLRRLDVGAGHALWSLSPYDAEGRPQPQVLTALRTLLREGGTGIRRVVLGMDGEAWGPLEERLRLTRGLLELMAAHGGVDLQVHTRTSLVARDGDLLRRLSSAGRVTVAFTLASLDERVNRWLEPGAPSALRRLMAMQALAHTGVVVGLRLTPLLPGLGGEPLDALLKRAAHAGARFVELGAPGIAPVQAAALRERTLSGERPPKALRRLAFRAGEAEELGNSLADRCLAVGLLPLDAPAPEPELPPVSRRAQPQRSTPRVPDEPAYQLTLFAP